MSLLIPWGAIEPITERIRGGAQPARARRPAAVASALRRGVAGAHVLLRAEVGSVQMPIERMLELDPGALLALEDRAEDGVLLFAEGVSLGRGRPGRSGARRAVKLDVDRRTARARRHLREARPRRARTRARAPATTRASGPRAARSCAASSCACGPSSAAPTCRSAARSSSRLGAVVELDQRAEAPVELFANGLCFANGSLVVTADGAWGVQVAELVE